MAWGISSSESPIGSITVISTGKAHMHPEHLYGSNTPQIWWILTSHRWVPLPVNVYLIEHREGLILFDTGLDRAVVTDTDYYPDGLTGFMFRHIFRFDAGPKDTLDSQLKQAGFSADAVRTAVISHLHFDHVGGIAEIPQADLVVSSEEWQSLKRPHPERHGIFHRTIEIPGARWNTIVFEPTDDASLAPFTHAFDLMGDGSLILLPTPGHTTGSISMLVRRDDGPPLLFIGDLAYAMELLQQHQIPGTGDVAQLQDTYAKVLGLKERMPELVILAAHDPQASARLRPVTPRSAVAEFAAKRGRA